MPGDKFKRVAAGEGLSISAATWNALLENAETNSRNAFNNTANLKSAFGVQSGLLIRVKNNSGADVDQFCPLGLDGGSVFSPTGEELEPYSFRHTPILTGGLPEKDGFGWPDAQFVITQEPIKNGDFGLCMLSGVTSCSVSVLNENHTHAHVDDENTDYLISSMHGHRILYKPSGIGEKVCLVSLGQMDGHPLRFAISQEEIGDDTFGGFKFAFGAKGSEIASGAEYQGYYRATSSTDPLSIPEGTLCFAIWVPCDTLEDDETGWELTPVRCIEEEA